MDIFICNWFGISLGMRVVNYFKMKVLNDYINFYHFRITILLVLKLVTWKLIIGELLIIGSVLVQRFFWWLWYPSFIFCIYTLNTLRIFKWTECFLFKVCTMDSPSTSYQCLPTYPMVLLFFTLSSTLNRWSIGMPGTREWYQFVTDP